MNRYLLEHLYVPLVNPSHAAVAEPLMCYNLSVNIMLCKERVYQVNGEHHALIELRNGHKSNQSVCKQTPAVIMSAMLQTDISKCFNFLSFFAYRNGWMSKCHHVKEFPWLPFFFSDTNAHTETELANSESYRIAEVVLQ